MSIVQFRGLVIHDFIWYPVLPLNSVRVMLFTVWSFVLPTGKMNLMVWGKLCWYSHPESMFPLPNILHVVLSKTLRWVLCWTTWTHMSEFKRKANTPLVLFLFFFQHSSRSCPLFASRLWERGTCGCRTPPLWLNRNHLDRWWDAGLPGQHSCRHFDMS